MKKSLIVLALMAGVASAQADTEASAESRSQSSSGAIAGSQSGALGNVVVIDQSGPTSQTINSTGKSDANVHYSGSVRNENVSSGTTTNRVEYSGTQTIKNVPGIAMSGPASGPCTGASGGLGVAGPGFGVGLNGAKVDDGCTVRENTRILGQLYQSLDSANPAKAQVQAALVKSMAIIEAMNDKIGADYLPKPVAEPKKAEAPVAAPKVAATPTPIMMPATNVSLVAPPKAEPTDPYIRARMGLPKLAVK